MPNPEAFKATLTKLAAPETVDDTTFADAVYTAMSEYGLDETKFRDAFGLSAGAVDRWTQRQNLPQPLVRSQILLWIKDNI
jgi:hypothetical protein